MTYHRSNVRVGRNIVDRLIDIRRRYNPWAARIVLSGHCWPMNRNSPYERVSRNLASRIANVDTCCICLLWEFPFPLVQHGKLGRCMSYDYARNARIKRREKRNLVTDQRYRSIATHSLPKSSINPIHLYPLFLPIFPFISLSALCFLSRSISNVEIFIFWPCRWQANSFVTL